MTRKQLLSLICDDVESGDGFGSQWKDLASIFSLLEVLKSESETAFKKIDWEGDVREGPFYFAIPSENSMSFGYALKQENNGNCFISSPVEMPHLKSIAFEAGVAG